MKKDMKRNDAIEESRSIENNQRQMDCQTKKEYEQGAATLSKENTCKENNL